MYPRKLLDDYTAAINKISASTQAGVRDAVTQIDLTDIADARNKIITVMDAYLEPATDATTTLGAAFYDACRQIELGERIGAIAENERIPEATHQSVKAFMQIIVDGGTREQLIDMLMERVDYEIKVAANEAVIYCGERDVI